MVIDAFAHFAKDKSSLTGGLAAWLATPRANFLRGGYVHANWDVEEPEKHKDEIADNLEAHQAWVFEWTAPARWIWMVRLNRDGMHISVGGGGLLCAVRK